MQFWKVFKALKVDIVWDGTFPRINVNIAVVYLICCSDSAFSALMGDKKSTRPVKSTYTAVFLAHHDSMVAACCLQVRNTVIFTGTITVFLTCQSSMLSPVRNALILQCSAFFVTVGSMTGRASGMYR